MIIGNINDLKAYGIGAEVSQQVREFLQNNDLKKLPDGKIELDGKRLFVSVQSGVSKLVSDGYRFEAHRKYMDIQYIVEGCEVMGWASTDNLNINVRYDESRDVLFGDVPLESTTYLNMQAGQLVLFYPGDAHAPNLCLKNPEMVKKLVFKVLLD